MQKRQKRKFPFFQWQLFPLQIYHWYSWLCLSNVLFVWTMLPAMNSTLTLLEVSLSAISYPGEEHCMATLKTAARETTLIEDRNWVTFHRESLQYWPCLSSWPVIKYCKCTCMFVTQSIFRCHLSLPTILHQISLQVLQHLSTGPLQFIQVIQGISGSAHVLRQFGLQNPHGEWHHGAYRESMWKAVSRS